ncbi:uncharacterized protein LOC116338388 isoform X2 [Contarinia nasturtii]|uniref:uncharacterized protein LOC116338388 isoform X2 n=1 Tax=Contarinia nasturtii TaxID=265458 RepID=UPI0012D39E8E|nr:uncharacterized protein LOC116338388 isoform X2 [Contarinia nasturtii]
MCDNVWIVFLLVCFVLSHETYAQTRGRSRVETSSQQIRDDIDENGDYDEDNASDNLQYYRTSSGKDEQNRVVLVAADDEYNGLYGHPTPPIKSRNDFNRPVLKTTSNAVRTKDVSSKETVQTIRNYSKVNDDGSFTFGYEAADGSFKEETRGTDCVVRGKYGYIDPDGNKREFTYVSGNPCDPNNPDQNEEDPEKESDKNEPENVPVNFPRKILRPSTQRHQTTTHPPTTVFQNQYTSNTYNYEQDDEDENASARPQHIPVPKEVTIRQKSRITINPTPGPLYQIQAQTSAKNNFRNTLETNPPATTYRPTIQFFAKKSTPITYSKPLELTDNKPIHFATLRKPVDFAAEFQKFQHANIVTSTATPPPKTQNLKTYRPQNTIQKIEVPNATPNPIYETKLVFDPTTGQIESSLFPQNVAYRIPATYVSTQQPQFHSSSQITLEQLQQQNQPVFQRHLQASASRAPLQLPQFSQQLNVNNYVTTFVGIS